MFQHCCINRVAAKNNISSGITKDPDEHWPQHPHAHGQTCAIKEPTQAVALGQKHNRTASGGTTSTPGVSPWLHSRQSLPIHGATTCTPCTCLRLAGGWKTNVCLATPRCSTWFNFARVSVACTWDVPSAMRTGSSSRMQIPLVLTFRPTYMQALNVNVKVRIGSHALLELGSDLSTLDQRDHKQKAERPWIQHQRKSQKTTHRGSHQTKTGIGRSAPTNRVGSRHCEPSMRVACSLSAEVAYMKACVLPGLISVSFVFDEPGAVPP